MTHLSNLEIVDLIDGVLPPDRAAHSERCEVCRARIEAVHETLARVAHVEIPEPSPLFWDHFSARVREGVEEAGAPQESFAPSWLQHAGFRWSVFGVVLTLLLAAGAWRFSAPGPATRNAPASRAASDGASAPDDWIGSADLDEAWALVRSVADETEWDDTMTAGLDVRPGWADRAALNLTADERDELLQLLKAEAKRPGA
jgi:hypothetical protein